jgi:hypothetical protein
MQAAPTYRWGLGFIAMRWRHVFWVLPLAGLLLGSGLQFWKLYGPTATGLIQAPYFGFSPGARPADVARLLHTDDFLSKAEGSLGLSKRWAIDPGTCVVKLRNMIRSDAVPGTSLVELRVTDASRTEAIEIWNTLARLTNQHFVEIRNASIESALAAKKATIEALQLDLDEKRVKLSAALKLSDLISDWPDSPYDQKKSAELEQIIADVETAQKALDIHLFSTACYSGEAPINVHEAPTFFSLNRWETLRPLLIHAGIGLCIGVLLTAPLAYLLELLLPRRSSDDHVGE